MKHLFFTILLTLSGLCASAQVKVETQIDSLQILIGEQAHISLSVTLPEGKSAQLPEFEYTQQITPGVEVLEAGSIDTTRLDNGMMQLSRVYTITSFDDTLYYLPPMKVVVDGKEYTSRNLALKVFTLEVDTLHPNQFFPQKTVQDNPFSWDEWKGLFWLSVLVVLLAALIYYLYIRLRDNKPIISKIRIVKHLPPHQKAMMEIKKIKDEHAEVSEDQKSYYTRLTDTLRTYLEERFGFHAMEMTSGEILERLRQEEDQNKLAELRDLLETADLVKFAKHSAMLNERDRNMESVVEFIQATKLDDAPTIERIQPNLSDSDRRSQRSRRIIIVLISVASIAAALLAAYVCWQVAMLIA